MTLGWDKNGRSTMIAMVTLVTKANEWDFPRYSML